MESKKIIQLQFVSGKKDSVTLSLDEALAKFKAEVDNKTLFGK